MLLTMTFEEKTKVILDNAVNVTQCVDYYARNNELSEAYKWAKNLLNNAESLADAIQDEAEERDETLEV